MRELAEGFFNKVDSFFLKKTVKMSFFWIILILTSISIYQLNHYYPLFADDYPFSMHYGDPLIRIQSLYDIFQSQYLFYIDHSGRTIEHTIAQLLLFIDTPWRDVLHTLAFVSLICVIYLIGNRKKKHNPGLLFILFMLIWFFQADFSTTVLNITSGAVYMWGTLINLLFILPYCNYFFGYAAKDSYIRILLFFFFGIIAGWTQENMAPTMIIVIATLMFLSKKETGKLAKWTVSGLIGAIIGCILLISAPGNFVRYETDPAATVAHTMPLVNGIHNIIGGYITHAVGITFVYLASLAIYLSFSRKENRKKVFQLSILFFGAALIATGGMVLSPIFPARAWFGIIVLMITAIGILYANLDFQVPFLRQGNMIVILFLFCTFALQYRKYSADLKQIHGTVTRRENIIEEQKNLGIQDIVLTEYITPKTHFAAISDVIGDSTHWLYPVMMSYYGVESVRFEKVLPEEDLQNLIIKVNNETAQSEYKK